MRKLLNTLYISTQGTYLHKEGETVVVEQEHRKVLQLPLHTIGGIVAFGNVLCSPFLLGYCAENDISISFLTEYGKFLAAVRGPVSGNVLLRREQYRKADCPEESRKIAGAIITGKLANSRVLMNRVIRDHGDKVEVPAIKSASQAIDHFINQIGHSESLDGVRGYEGLAANEYFQVFNHFIIDQKDSFQFKSRNRRPPLDEVNALLSFVYTLLSHDVRSALETVGLDPAVGFLHRDRPGRSSLALDMMEEFRPVIADRLVLTLINRRQISAKGFTRTSGGAVSMDSDIRKTVLVEYQSKKKDEVFHPYIEETVPVGMLFFLQANLMARFIRGDIDGYPPYFWR